MTDASAPIDPQQIAPPPAKRLNRRVLVAAGVFLIVVFWVGALLLVNHSGAQRQAELAQKPAPASAEDRAALAKLQEVIDNAQRNVSETERRLAEQQASMQQNPLYNLPPGGYPPGRGAVGRELAPPEDMARSADERYPVTPSNQPSAAEQTYQRALASGLAAPGFGPAVAHGDDGAPGMPAMPKMPAMPSFPDLKLPNLSASDPNAAPPEPDYLDRKDHFLKDAASRGSDRINAVAAAPPALQLLSGTLIPAILITGVNSDLPGQATASVRRDVYDSTTGHTLLIPQGSRLIGEYDNRIAFGQKRVLLAWQRVIFPDGRSIDLRGMPGADLEAAAGLKDRVNTHFASVFGHALLLSALSAGVQLSQPQQSADGRAPSASQVAAAAIGQELSQVTSQILRRYLTTQPTLEIRPGYLFNVEVTADMVFAGAYASALPAAP